jgi:hypothetical protein
MIRGIDLDGNEHQLIAPLVDESTFEKHKAKQTIIPFLSFGIGTKLSIDKEDEYNLTSINGMLQGINSATVYDIRENNKKVIIKAKRKRDLDDKIYFVNQIINNIDFDNALTSDIFLKMFANVFTESELNEILACDEVEIISFNGLMYLKVNDKAYRL